MSIEKIHLRNAAIIGVILVAGAFRLIDLGKFGAWANFTPVGAIALFAGTYFKDKWKAYLVPLLTLLLTDWIIYYAYFKQLVFFYDGMIWVYLSFALIVFVGSLIEKVNVVNVLSASIVSVVIHWLISDIQPWLEGTTYPLTFAGYIQCLIAAIPFEKNLLLGNLVYGSLLYGGFELLKAKVPAMSYNKPIIR